jgi:hypothetical protein
MKQLISVSDLIDQSWIKYRSSFPFFLQISGWLVILAIMNTVALLLYPSAGAVAFHNTLTASEITGVILYTLSNVILSPLIGFWVFVALAIGAKSVITHERMSILQVMQETKKRFLPALVVSVLVGLTLLLAQIITVGPSIILGAIGFFVNNNWILGAANALLLLGLIASLILTSRWTLYYVMSPYAAILDHAKNKQALLKSRKLIEGKFWNVLFRLLVPKIVFILFGVLFAVLVNTVISSLVIGSTGYNLDVQKRIIDLASSVLPLLIAIFLNPLIFLSDVLLYQSLTEQSE